MSDTPEEAPEVPKTVRQRHQSRRMPMEQRAKTSRNTSARRSSQEDNTAGIAKAIAEGIADGLKVAIAGSKEFLLDVLVEADSRIEAKRLANVEPEIPYNDRLHTLKIIFEMAWFVVSFVVTTALVFPAMGLAATNQLNIGLYIALAYIVVCVGICYFAAREHFKWSKLDIIRKGGILRAVRPSSNFFLLAELNANLNLRTVVGVYETAPWLMRVLGISRIVMELQETNSGDSEDEGGGSGSDENDKKSKKRKAKKDAFDFKLMRWIKNGNQMIAAVTQGSGMA